MIRTDEPPAVQFHDSGRGMYVQGFGLAHLPRPAADADALTLSVRRRHRSGILPTGPTLHRPSALRVVAHALVEGRKVHAGPDDDFFLMSDDGSVRLIEDQTR